LMSHIATAESRRYDLFGAPGFGPILTIDPGSEVRSGGNVLRQFQNLGIGVMRGRRSCGAAIIGGLS
jgi:hypothetical protein